MERCCLPSERSNAHIDTGNPAVYANAPVMDKLCIAIDFTTIDIEGVNVYSFVFLLNSNVAQK